MKPRKEKLSTYIKKLDSIFSLYIRTKYSNHGWVKCITCDRSFPIKQMDAGHYISRNKMSTRYLEENVHPQCRYCNRYMGGQKDIYALELQKKYGKGILEWLNQQKNTFQKYMIWELKGLIIHYKNMTPTNFNGKE